MLYKLLRSSLYNPLTIHYTTHETTKEQHHKRPHEEPPAPHLHLTPIEGCMMCARRMGQPKQRAITN